MITKLPACYDTSHWKEILDFTLVSPRPLLFITKATESDWYIDDKFVRFFAGMAQIGVRRGAYHFHRKAISATRQAALFINTVRPHITNRDILILDVEEGGETAAQLKQWLEIVRAEFPNNLLMIYSRKNILDPIPMTQAQRDFFKQIPTWVAGYPIFPDLYNSIPTGYIPDQGKWGAAWLWQYSDKGVVAGIQGSVDLNYIHPTLRALIGDVVPPPPPTGDTMEYTCTVLQQQKGYKDHNTTSPQMGLVNVGATFKGIQLWGNWVQHSDGRWFDTYKQGALAIRVVEVVVVPPPPPPPTKILTNIIDVYNDGSIDVKPQ